MSSVWDRISSEEATLLVASYLAHRTHPDIPKAQLAKLFPLAPSTEPRPYPAEDLPGSPSRWVQNWTYEGDTNAATHLIRNAIAGADKKYRSEMLSLHGKVSRYKRDDMTVTWVFSMHHSPFAGADAHAGLYSSTRVLMRGLWLGNPL